MKIGSKWLGLAMVLAWAAGAGARAKGDLVYNNGPVGSKHADWGISNGLAVTDSFTVSGPVSLESAVVALRTYQSSGDPTALPTSVDWSIGTTEFGSDVASGTASLTDADPVTDSISTTFESSFSLSGSLTSGTTYWLTLSNAQTDSPGAGVYWAANNGPSSADQEYVSPYQTIDYGSVSSESFQLESGTNPSIVTPEPSTLVSGAIAGAVGFGYAWRRRRKRRVKVDAVA